MAEDLQLNEQQQIVHNHTLISSSSSSPSSSSSSASTSLPALSPAFPPEPVIVAGKIPESLTERAGRVEVHASPLVNRCVECRRRVGLTGFKCRCGMTFCGTHRYPERHACDFDFKAMGKDQIARDNPLIKAEKLRKI